MTLEEWERRLEVAEDDLRRARHFRRPSQDPDVESLRKYAQWLKEKMLKAALRVENHA